MQNNNYPKWLVPLSIAKELKEIGFGTPCTFLWDSHGDVNEIRCYLDEHPEECDVFLPGSYNYNNPNSSGYYSYTSLPTWEQVFEWFREKGFITNIYYKEDLLSEKTMFIGEICNTKADIISIIHECSAYEEAREGLVNKLIEVYKKE